MMKKYLFLPILFCFLSCKKEQPNDSIQPAVKTESSIKKEIEIEEENNNPVFSADDFKLVYDYSEEDSKQLLGINILDDKTIEFHLTTTTLPCDTEYWGKAFTNFNGNSEVDDDEEGGYFVIEYFKEEKEYQLGIRLAEDKSKVQVVYIQKDSLETDCLPIEEKIMKRIK